MNKNKESGQANPHKLSHGQNYLSGAFGGWACGWVGAPVEHFRIRMQIQSGPKETHKYKSCFDSLKKIHNEAGTKGVFRGLNATLARDSIGYGFYFMIYEWLR